MAIDDDITREVNRRLPRFDELPLAEGGARSAWGLFGPDDSLGMLNLVDEATSLAASRLVRRGAVFPLDIELGTVTPPFFSRGRGRHTVVEKVPDKALDDVYDDFWPQSGSQWDALAHIAFQPGRFYNGASKAEVVEQGRDTIGHWGRHGVATRGVLLDVADAVARGGGAGESTPVTVADLEAARTRAGIEYRPGDVLLVRTGFLGWYRAQGPQSHAKQANPDTLTAAGIGQSEEMARYLWDAGFAAVATDTAGFECWPPDRSEAGFPYGFLHQILLGQFGMGIGELWDLDALAADCAVDGVCEVFLVSAPLNAPRGIGSPANAVAIK
ncbi:MAG TPA: cyclase family protein [Gryllotalpicola sp.]